MERVIRARISIPEGNLEFFQSMRPFWGTACRRSFESLSSAQVASVCSAGRGREFDSACRGGGFSSSLRPKPSASVCSVCHGPLNGPFLRAVFHHGGAPENISVNGPFSDLNGPFPRRP